MGDFGLVAGAVSRALSETLEGVQEGELGAFDIRRQRGEMARKRREAEMKESLFPGALRGQQLGIEEKEFGIAESRQLRADQEYTQAKYRKMTADGAKEPTLPEWLSFYSDPRVKRAGYDTPKSLEIWRKFMETKTPDPKDEAALLMKQRNTLVNEFSQLYKQFTVPGFYPEIEERDKALARLKQIRQTLQQIDRRLQEMGGAKPPPLPELPSDKSAEGNTWTDWFNRIISDAMGGAGGKPPIEAQESPPFDFLPTGPSIERTITPPKAPPKPKPLAAAKKPPANPTPQAAIAEGERLVLRGHTPESAVKAMQDAGWDVE